MREREGGEEGGEGSREGEKEGELVGRGEDGIEGRERGGEAERGGRGREKRVIDKYYYGIYVYRRLMVSALMSWVLWIMGTSRK